MIKICPICGKEFKTHVNAKKFCNDCRAYTRGYTPPLSCCQSIRKALKPKKCFADLIISREIAPSTKSATGTIKKCIICGKKFDSVYPHQLTCDKTCRREKQRRYHKARRLKHKYDTEWHDRENERLRERRHKRCPLQKRYYLDKNRIRQLIKDSGLSAAQLSRNMGMNRAYLFNRLKENCRATQSTIERIAAIFGVEHIELIMEASS